MEPGTWWHPDDPIPYLTGKIGAIPVQGRRDGLDCGYSVGTIVQRHGDAETIVTVERRQRRDEEPLKPFLRAGNFSR
jgi:hypothetical protein